ncbi:MAG: hypothetical protein E4G91_04360 [Candidatus Zixiibacteriota bacterium]|nr:MAG: hypothetical protein E4G91_04360 [candidate division Zixibacteria bacterium]
MPIRRLSDAKSDLFLCAAQIAGSNTDPEEQEDDLMYVVNQCCAASRFDRAVEVLESIADESVRAEALAAVDSFSLDDRRMLEHQKFELTPEAYKRWNTDYPIKSFKISLKPTELERLVALTQSFSTPENRIVSLIKAGSLLCRYGNRDKGISILHSALPVLDSVQNLPYCEELGQALLDAGDTATGVAVLGRALVRSIDSCSYVTPKLNWNYEVLHTIIDAGAYDMALEVGSEHGDSTTVQSEIAISLANKGRCREALERLLTCAEGGQKYIALEDVSVACAEQGEDSVAQVALSMLYQIVFADSTSSPLVSHRYYQVLDVVGAYAAAGFVEKALEIASLIPNTNHYYYWSLLEIAARVDENGKHDSALVLLKDISAATASIADSVKRNEIIRSLAYRYLSWNEIPLVRQMISSMLDEYDRSEILRELAFRYVRFDSCQQALAIAQEMNDADDQIDLKMSIADSCFAIGRMAFALGIVDEIGDSVSISHPYVYSGGEYDAMTAISIYARGGEMEKAARLAKQWERTAFEPVALIKMAEGYIGIGEPRSALPLLSAARKACRNLRLEPNTQPPVETWQKIAKLYARAGAFTEALQTVREMNISPRYAFETLADLALAFTKTGRELNSAEKTELQQIISQYCK